MSTANIVPMQKIVDVHASLDETFSGLIGELRAIAAKAKGVIDQSLALLSDAPPRAARTRRSGALASSAVTSRLEVDMAAKKSAKKVATKRTTKGTKLGAPRVAKTPAKKVGAKKRTGKR